MEFWNSTLTEKSWNILLEINKKPFKFIVIGGWAAYLWTKLHKSKDLDIVLKDMQDLDYLKQNYAIKKNDNLKKYEISFEEIDVDIYVPFFSKLSIPVNDIKNYTTKIEGIEVVSSELLLILKQGAEFDRAGTIKGNKDQIDIIALICFTNVDFKKYNDILKKYKLEHFRARLKQIIINYKDIKYLDLNPRQFKLKKEELLKKI